MTCYNVECKDYGICDIYKQATCIKKISKQRYFKKTQVIRDDKYRCPKCKRFMEEGKYIKSRKKVLICPVCNIKIDKV